MLLNKFFGTKPRQIKEQNYTAITFLFVYCFARRYNYIFLNSLRRGYLNKYIPMLYMNFFNTVVGNAFVSSILFLFYHVFFPCVLIFWRITSFELISSPFFKHILDSFVIIIVICFIKTLSFALIVLSCVRYVYLPLCYLIILKGHQIIVFSYIKFFSRIFIPFFEISFPLSNNKKIVSSK